MEITTLGVIACLKNIGLWLGTNYTLGSIEANPQAFFFMFLIYILISVPSDLYLLNNAHESGLKKGNIK